MTHTLLPRSTGLQYSLRALAPRIPALQLVDITVAYPGMFVFRNSQRRLTFVSQEYLYWAMVKNITLSVPYSSTAYLHLLSTYIYGAST